MPDSLEEFAPAGSASPESHPSCCHLPDLWMKLQCLLRSLHFQSAACVCAEVKLTSDQGLESKFLSLAQGLRVLFQLDAAIQFVKEKAAIMLGLGICLHLSHKKKHFLLLCWHVTKSPLCEYSISCYFCIILCYLSRVSQILMSGV